MFILDICTQDIRSEEDSEDCTSLIGLRLLPLGDGSLSHFGDAESNDLVFVCSRWNETRMLEPISFLLVDPRVVGESDERKPQNLISILLLNFCGHVTTLKSQNRRIQDNSTQLHLRLFCHTYTRRSGKARKRYCGTWKCIVKVRIQQRYPFRA